MNEEENAKVHIDLTAKRIQFKRVLRRRKQIDKVRNTTLLVTIILAIGFVTYGITEITASMKLTASAQPKKAHAAEIDPQIKSIYDCFGLAGTTDLKLSLPGRMGSVVALGFHEAEKKEALAMQPSTEYYNRETTTTVRKAIGNSKCPVMFVMASRGRGSAPTSAVDIAMMPGSEVYSPVDGIVKLVRTYNLYGKLMDDHVEIEPDGYPNIRVAIIHIDNVQVAEGQRVKRQLTHIGTMRALPQIQSQINKYLPEAADHVHLQINPATVEGKMNS